jgi:hypothetical protein
MATANYLRISIDTAPNAKNMPEPPYASNLPFVTMKTLILIIQYTLTSCILMDHHYSTSLMKRLSSKLQDGLTTVFQLYVSGKLCK